MLQTHQESIRRSDGGTVLPQAILIMTAILIISLAILDKILFTSASDQYPVQVYAKDFDKNGIFDMIPSFISS